MKGAGAKGRADSRGREGRLALIRAGGGSGVSGRSAEPGPAPCRARAGGLGRRRQGGGESQANRGAQRGLAQAAGHAGRPVGRRSRRRANSGGARQHRTARPDRAGRAWPAASGTDNCRRWGWVLAGQASWAAGSVLGWREQGASAPVAGGSWSRRSVCAAVPCSRAAGWSRWFD